jgi:hypothetical protein
MIKDLICIETYEDALSWTSDRCYREAIGIANYMSVHWSIMSDENRNALLREYRALQLVMRNKHLH